jgi:transposase
MQTYYRSHAGKQPNKIIVKVAHKLLRRIWHVIKLGDGYKTGHSESCKEPDSKAPTC